MSNKITSMNDVSIKNFFKDDILNFRNYPVSEVNIPVLVSMLSGG